MIRRIQVRTSARDDWVDLTGEVQSAARESGISETVFSPPGPPEGAAVITYSKVPWRGDWNHCEDNAASHMKAAVVGSSVQVVFSAGKLLLGTWQNVFLCEFDGPRARDVILRAPDRINCWPLWGGGGRLLCRSASTIGSARSPRPRFAHPARRRSQIASAFISSGALEVSP